MMEIERLIEQLRRFGGELGATPLNNVIGKYMIPSIHRLSAVVTLSDIIGGNE